MQNSANLFSHEVHAGVQIVFHFFLGEKQSMQIKPVSKRHSWFNFLSDTISFKPFRQTRQTRFSQILIPATQMDSLNRKDWSSLKAWPAHHCHVRPLFSGSVPAPDRNERCLSLSFSTRFSAGFVWKSEKKNSSSGRLKGMSPFLERFPGLLSGTRLVRIHVETAALGDGSHLAVQCLAPLEASTDSLSLHVLSSQTSFGGS